MPRGFALITGQVSVTLKLLTVAITGGGLAIGTALWPNQAKALLIYTIKQTQDGVKVTGGSQGVVDLSQLTFIPFDPLNPETNTTEIVSSLGALGTGPSGAELDTYVGISRPTSFGTDSFGYGGFSSSTAGNAVYLSAFNSKLYVPRGYVSRGSGLIDSETIFAGLTLEQLGLTPGSSFTWTWGAGGASETFQLDILPVPAPLPLFGAASAYGWSRRLRRRIRNRAAVAPGSTTNI